MNVPLQEEVTCTVLPLPNIRLCNFKQQFTGNSGSSFYNENGQKVVFFKDKIKKNVLVGIQLITIWLQSF